MKDTLFQSLLADPCAGFVMSFVTYALGKLSVTGRERLRRFGGAVAGVAVLCFVWTSAYGVKRPDVLGLAVRAASLGLATLGVSWIVLALADFLFDALVGAPLRARRERERLKREAECRREEADRQDRKERQRQLDREIRRGEREMRRLKEELNRPTPPSKDELARRAREEYDRAMARAAIVPDPFQRKVAESAAARRLAGRLRQIEEGQ